MGPTASLDPEALLSLNSGTGTQPRFPTDGKNTMSAFDPSIYGQTAKFDVQQQKIFRPKNTPHMNYNTFKEIRNILVDICFDNPCNLL